MKIALACDHTGFEQLKDLKTYLESLGHQCHNFGPDRYQAEDDYPDFIRPAAEAVAKGDCERGIILGGSGQGEAIVANRVKGVRCGVFYGSAVPRRVVEATGRVSHDPYEIIRLLRQHNDSNMLSLAARFVSPESMKRVVELWLTTDFSDDERHKRRISKIDGAI